MPLLFKYFYDPSHPPPNITLIQSRDPPLLIPSWETLLLTLTCYWNVVCARLQPHWLLSIMFEITARERVGFNKVLSGNEGWAACWVHLLSDFPHTTYGDIFSECLQSVCPVILLVVYPVHTTSTAWVCPGGTIPPLLLSLRFLAFLQLWFDPKDRLLIRLFVAVNWNRLNCFGAAIQNRLFTEWNELLDCYITLDST